MTITIQNKKFYQCHHTLKVLGSTPFLWFLWVYCTPVGLGTQRKQYTHTDRNKSNMWTMVAFWSWDNACTYLRQLDPVPTMRYWSFQVDHVLAASPEVSCWWQCYNDELYFSSKTHVWMDSYYLKSNCFFLMFAKNCSTTWLFSQPFSSGTSWILRNMSLGSFVFPSWNLSYRT